MVYVKQGFLIKKIWSFKFFRSGHIYEAFTKQFQIVKRCNKKYGAFLVYRLLMQKKKVFLLKKVSQEIVYENCKLVLETVFKSH